MPRPSSSPSHARDHRMWGYLGAATVAVMLFLGAAACGSDSGGSTTATSGAASASGTAPEDKQVTDAEVTAGFAKMPALFAAAVAAGAGDADAKFEAIEENWREFEGTVRSKEPDLYISFEDELSNLHKAMGDGDKAKAAESQAKLESIISQYQAKHP
jgi:hypothetical protein